MCNPVMCEAGWRVARVRSHENGVPQTSDARLGFVSVAG